MLFLKKHLPWNLIFVYSLSVPPQLSLLTILAAQQTLKQKHYTLDSYHQEGEESLVEELKSLQCESLWYGKDSESRVASLNWLKKQQTRFLSVTRPLTLKGGFNLMEICSLEYHVFKHSAFTNQHSLAKPPIYRGSYHIIAKFRKMKLQ